MRRRSTVSLRPLEPEADASPPAPAARPSAFSARPPGSARPQGLRRTSALPPRAKLFIVVVGLALLGFLAWLTYRLFQLDSEPVAILLSVLSYIGGVVVGIAVLTLTRIAFSLGALPYLLGRGVRRLLTGRRR